MLRKITIILLCAVVSCDKTDYSVTYLDCDAATSSGCPIRQLYESNAPAVYNINTKLDFSKNLSKLLKKKPKTVICLNGDGKADMIDAAKENKATTFVLQDIKLNGIPDNMICVNIDIFTVSFAAGCFAGYCSQTTHAAFISDDKTSVSSRLCDGFSAGMEFVSGGTCEKFFASEENDDILTLAENTAESDCDIAFVYSENHFDEIKEIFAEKSKNVIAVGKTVEGNTILSFQPIMSKIYSDLANKINEGKSTGSRLTYGMSFFTVDVSESGNVSDSALMDFSDLKKDIEEGNIWIDETKSDKGIT